ncbi:DUF7003 family protein [Shouchella lonarensis]|uniref:Uncharacterized protein n=1 Tax=Shouchella lonarensis TaxID=1464122 RepID=A0A1G6GK97_9BACI|nr:hypothetical protein [Shouchella lonarensis]SDB82273.1 hypothetical protein SAMN05421737_101164 [Shouchella lonarensis]
MVTKESVLEILDGHFDNVKRPYFEDRELDYIGSKISIFRLNESDWMINLQFFQRCEDSAFIESHFYSNQLKRQYKVDVFDPFYFKTSDGEEIDYEASDASDVKKIDLLQVYSQAYPLTKEQMYQGDATIKETAWKEFLRDLFSYDSFREKLWLNQQELLEGFKYDKQSIEAFAVESEAFQFPDYLTSPSEISCFQSIAESLERNDPKLINFDTPNNEWKEWMDYDYGDDE